MIDEPALVGAFHDTVADFVAATARMFVGASGAPEPWTEPHDPDPVYGVGAAPLAEIRRFPPTMLKANAPFEGHDCT